MEINNTQNEPIVESIEEQMIRLYQEKERNSKDIYNKILYKNAPPLTDEEKKRVKWRNGRRYLN